MKNLLFSLLLVAAVFFSGCEPLNKAQYLRQYRSFLEEVKTGHKEFSDPAWQKNDERLKAFTGDYYDKFESELTSEEQAEVWAGALKYYFYRYKSGALNLIRNSKDKEFKRFRKELDATGKSGSKALEEAMPELEALGEELKEAGGELKETLKEINRDFLKNLEESLKEVRESLEETDAEKGK
jgi:hypothetical protein